LGKEKEGEGGVWLGDVWRKREGGGPGGAWCGRRSGGPTNVKRAVMAEAASGR
jgi:hypothetical protein